ncbi:MAG: flavodoxin family protein [Deltaproteobacteria bacterium]|nr:flavodoxin family protein [Deltaproteobacteria bacterium]
MGKIIVIYHSQQYGNTKILAEALAEGAREAGAEVSLINTNERRVTLEEFLSTDAVAIGTPDYFSYVAGTIKTFFDDMYLWDQSGKSVKGKPAVLFFSCGGGGKVKQPFESLVQRFFQQVGETVGSERPISNEAKKKCFTLGKELVETLSNRTSKK